MTTDSKDRADAKLDAYVAEAGHLVAEMAGELVLLHKDKGQYFGLNRVGKRVWDLLQTRVRSEDIVSVVADEFAAEQSVIRRDVERLLGELVDAGLARRTS